MPSSPVRARRLFFALWPDEPLRADAAHLGRKWLHKQGKHLKPDNLHITLAFLGNVPAEQYDCVVAAGSAVAAAPFELRLDRLGQFLRARVAWLGASELPVPLLELVAELSRQLIVCGYTPESRPYHPHLTLARKINRTVEPIGFEPLVWPVGGFVLVESFTHPEGVEYRVVERWPIKAGG